uniref:Uncharacterized protein n=1 Tax=Acrobeloides nanus TaxID=290746 RepID=A0A914DE76_9BILA
MADDLNNVASYMNDIRICFIALTITVYLVIIGYFVMLCVRRNRRTVNGRRPRSQWDYQIESQTGDTRNTGQTEDLIAVRSETTNTSVGVTSMGHRNHRNPPSFMRHSGATHVTANHQGLSHHTTRLVNDRDGTVKHQIPHITTEPPSEESTQTSLAGSKLHHRTPGESVSVEM